VDTISHTIKEGANVYWGIGLVLDHILGPFIFPIGMMRLDDMPDFLMKKLPSSLEELT
jgi:hypothetical protein